MIAARFGRQVLRTLRRYTFAFALLLVAVLLTVSLVLQPNFQWTQQLAAFAPLAVAALASTPSILSGRGGIDMSVSPVMTMSAILFVGVLVPLGLGGPESIGILLILGAAIGTITGLIVVKLRLSPIVVSLAMYFIVIGINLKLAPVPVQLRGDNWVTSLAGSIGPVPGALISILIPLVLWTVLRSTAYGRNLYSVGGNDATAFSAGVNVAAVRIIAFASGSAIAAFGGLVLVGLVRTADSSTSGAYTLNAIAAVALGGTSLAGGRGGVIGTLLGAAVIFLVQGILSDLQVAAVWLPVVYGTLLIAAVVIGAALFAPKQGART
jgi:ribose transport system permease protein